MLVTSKELFKQAQLENYAIPAPNFIDIESMKAYIEVAEKLQQPLILALAEVHLDMISLEDAAYMGRHLAEEASVPVVLHLDHGMTMEVVKKAVDLGFTSVMIDASALPFEENVNRTKEVVAYAHAKGVVVEAEIGHVGSGENYENHEHTDSKYTTVEEAIAFVEATHVDSLAVSIGTAHGMYKGKPEINFERLQELRQAVDTPLVLHGGSSSGDDNLNRCATEGICKINICSDIINAAMTNIEAKQPKNYLEVKEVVKVGMKDCVEHYYQVFNPAITEVSKQTVTV